jgi:hypothetical protein
MSYRIYKIVCNETGKTYYGSTGIKLEFRLERHEQQYLMWRGGLIKNKVSVFEILKGGNYQIELVEELGFCSKTDMLWRERHYIDNYECINQNRPIRTEEERKYHKKLPRKSNIKTSP